MKGTTLCLNASMEPMTVLPLERAMILILDQKADILEEDHGNPVRSAHKEFARPLVIRMRTYINIPWGARVALNKKNLYTRDKGECQYCGKPVGISGATIDHIIPRSRGGSNAWTNTCLCCSRCNWNKGDKLLSELGWELRSTPRVPQRRGRHILVGASENPAWEQYLAAFT